MITAEQARAIMPRTLEVKLEDIGNRIEELAKEGKNRLRGGYDYDKDKDLWISGGYSNSEEYLKAKQYLENLGFKVSFYYMELQLVDMYVLIEW
jgi:hypothetical protein